MATPTVSAISPATGHTGGRNLVEIDGTNFRTPTAQSPVAGITPVAPASVAVTFGGVPALEVRWLSPVLLYVVPPPHDSGPVSVVVQNVADDGTPIMGESVTVAAGYTYQLPILTSDQPSDLKRLVEALVADLRRQVTANTKWPVSTDYDSTTKDELSVAELPTLPGLVIASFSLRENDFYSTRARPAVDNEAGDGYVELDPPDTVDLVFTIVGLSNSSAELLNLSAATRRYFKKNPYLVMQRDGADPSKGSVSYELTAYEDKEARHEIAASADNVKHFSMVVVIHGFDIEGLAGIALGGPAGLSEGQTDFGPKADEIIIEPTEPL